MPRAIVIGAGITGLATAHRLLQHAPGLEVSVLEASDRAGGWIRSEEYEGFVIEHGPDAILTEKPAALSLIRDLGLSDELIGTAEQPRGAYVVSRGRLVRVPDGFSVVAPSDLGALWRSPILSTRGKLRSSLDRVLPRGPERADESLASFVRRRFGQEMLERLAQPMAGGIYGADPEILSLRATMPRFLEIEAEHRSVIGGLKKRVQANTVEVASGARYGMFVSFARGMETFPSTLAERLNEHIRFGADTRSIEASGAGYTVTLADGETLAADYVVVTLPTWRAAEVVASMDATLSTQLGAIDYGSLAAVTVAYRRDQIPHPLDAFGFVVPTVEDRPVLASTWSSIKWAGRAPEGMSLLRIFVGGQARPDAPSWSDDELKAAVRRELRAWLGIEAAPTFTRVGRFMRGMPRYHVGHLDRIAAVERRASAHPGFELAGAGYRGVGIPDSVRSADRAATRIALLANS